MTRTPSKPVPLAEALGTWLDQSGLRRRLEQVEAVERWAEIVGPQIAAVTRAVAVTADGTLLVQVATHTWATELGLMAPRILARVNGARQGRVGHIRWLVGPLDRP